MPSDPDFQRGLFDAAAIASPLRKARWREELSQLHGPVDLQEVEGSSLLGRLLRAPLWRLLLYRLELAPHRLVLPRVLARPGTHHFSKLHFQTSGQTMFAQNGQTLLLHPGECLVFNLAWPHELASDGDSAHVAVIVPHDLIRRLSVPVELLRTAHHITMDDGARFALGLAQRYLEDAPALGQASAAKLAEAVLTLMRSSLAHGAAGLDSFSGPTILRWRAKTYIQEHLRDSALDVTAIAKALGCSKRHLHTVFHDEGKTVQRYIWDLRLAECLAELTGPANPVKSVTDIAFSWGFSSSAHFSRAFRKAYGQSPSAARAAAQDDARHAP